MKFKGKKSNLQKKIIKIDYIEHLNKKVFTVLNEYSGMYFWVSGYMLLAWKGALYLKPSRIDFFHSNIFKCCILAWPKT